MAITKIIAIRDRLDKRVNYAVNGEKTTLDTGITYAANPEKTEQLFFTSAINCDSCETAFAEMQTTKRRFGKLGGVVGYHFIQSFAPGEVTPEQAHRIGVEFAQRLFGERYEVVVGTHLHNHVVVNSVSFVDGKKYHSSPGSYYFEVRSTSDILCRENDLSTITPQGKGKHYAEWKAENTGKPTIRSIIRGDIDRFVGEAYTYETFLMLLRQEGYVVRNAPSRKYVTVLPPGGKRAIRLDSLGEGYTEQDIRRRLTAQREGGAQSAPAMTRTGMAVESDITRWQQRQNHHNNFSANIPYDLEQMRKETREFLDDLTARDQRMMYALVTLTHLADNEEQLEQDTEALSAIGRSHGCQFAIMKHQQEDALNTVLPYGLRRIDAMRTLTTESTAVLLPFKTQEIMDTGGLYYGVNAVSRNLIICNRDAMLNGHGLYMGVSGSGKSMMAKQEIGFVGLNTNHDIIVVDPEREYGPLIRALGGEVITISASNGSYVNALDISKEYGDGRNPLVLKSEFIMSLCEQLMGAGEIGAKEKSIIDRCTANIYRKYIRKYEGEPPTLKDLYDDLMRQKEPVAHEIALALELFTTGSLNVFAHQTNIDTRNRIICYDIQDLGENLKPIGLLVMLDSILNRVIRNRQQGRYTHVYIDEIYLFFASPGVGGKSAINNYSSEFLYKCWKRFRKYYATLTGITQNVEECLLSDTARLMFANSEFLVLLNQAPTDRAELAKLLDASDAQMDYVSDAPAGHGLIKVGSCLVPFINELPRDTELYRLMTTKPNEKFL